MVETLNEEREERGREKREKRRENREDSRREREQRTELEFDVLEMHEKACDIVSKKSEEI